MISVFVLTLTLILFGNCYHVKNSFLKFRDVDGTISRSHKFTPQELKANEKFIKSNENPFEFSGFFETNKTVGGSLYYVFFPSQDGNENAPLVIWLQGGPGCGSETGLFGEIGPYYVDDETLELKDRDSTWNDKYHMLFIDQPFGSGFSYVNDSKGYVTDEEQVAHELYKFLLMFYSDDRYAKYKKNELFIFGESYAGKYIPTIAHKIMTEGFEVNLKGVAIGDGLTHPIVQFTTYSDFSNGLVLTDDLLLPKIVDWEKQIAHFIEAKKWADCGKVQDEMMGYIEEQTGGVNVYDVRTFNGYDFSYGKYLNLPSTKKLMHTEGIEFHDCSQKAWDALSSDIPQSILYKVSDLVNANVSTTFYSGQFDLLVNPLGTYRMLKGMDWKYSKQWANTKRDLWKYDGKNVGAYVTQYENLAFYVIPQAGHLSPMDQPVILKEMAKKIIEG